jgi:hypothetical protein
MKIFSIKRFNKDQAALSPDRFQIDKCHFRQNAPEFSWLEHDPASTLGHRDQWYWLLLKYTIPGIKVLQVRRVNSIMTNVRRSFRYGVFSAAMVDQLGCVKGKCLQCHVAAEHRSKRVLLAHRVYCGHRSVFFDLFDHQPILPIMTRGVI